MNRDTIASLASALLPLVLLALAAFAAWAGRLVSRYVRDRRYALAVELVALGAAGVVADLFQHVVADLKNPTKPGAWNEVSAAAVKLRAVARLRELYPHAVAVITGVLADPSKVDALFGTFVEKGVVEMKGLTSAASTLAASVVRIGGDGPAIAAELAARLDEDAARRPTTVPPVVLGALLLALASCGPGRNALLAATPGVPPVSGCAVNTYRCNGAVPEACSASGRWWPALPRDAQGVQRTCPAGCALTTEGVAACTAPDGGA